MNVSQVVRKRVESGSRRQWVRVSIAAIVICLIAILVSVAPASAGGAMQISGIGYLAGPGECEGPVPHEGTPDLTIKLTGDLEGCWYVFVESAVCSPSGTYRERGVDVYVGTGNEGDTGTFTTTYLFTGKFEDCPNLAGEIFGRCQHPIEALSGTGEFSGVTGRLDFKDDLEAGNFPYRGHLKW